MIKTKMIKIFSSKSFFFLVLLIVPLLVMFVRGMEPVYYNNDDFFLKQIVSGEYTGTPETHLIHVGYLTGLIISSLYKIIPSFPWYGLYLFGCAFMSIVLAFSTLSKYMNKVWQKLILLGVSLFLICGFLFPHLLQLQYTTITAIVCAAAMVCFYNGKEETDTKEFLKSQLPSVVLFCISFQLRDKACVMFLPLFCLLVVSRLLQNKAMKKAFFAYGCILASCLIVMLGIELLAYSSEEWNEFSRYNTNRENVVDYEGFPEYEEHKDMYEKLGISYASYMAANDLGGYMLLLDPNIDANFMEVLASESFKTQVELSQMIAGFLQMHIEPRFDWPINRMVFLMYGMCVLMAILTSKYKALLDVLAVFGGRMIIWVYLLYIGRPISRVTQGVYVVEMLLLISVFSYHKLWIGKKNKRKFLLNALLAFGLTGTILVSIKWGFTNVKGVVLQNDAKQKEFTVYEEVSEYFLSNKENLYLLDVWSFADYVDRVFVTTSEQRGNCVMLGGWSANSPWTDRIAKNHGFTSYEVAALEEENVYFVFRNSENTSYLYLENYYADKYPGTTLEIQDVIQTSEGVEFYVLKCR